MYDRRQFLRNSTAAGIASQFSMLLTPAAFAGEQQIGEWNVSTYSDGHLQLPISFLLPDVPKAEAEKLLAENNLPIDAVKPPLNVTIASNGTHRIMFDVGSGSNFMPTAGKLPATLENNNIDPGSITDVAFTHAHPDHLWGILDDFDEIAFPEANFYFPRKEWEFWTSDDAIEKMGEGRETFAVGAKNRLDLLKERVQLIDEGSEPIAGIEAMATNGHTPGHMSYVVHDEGESVVILGDALTNHIISFVKPDWPSGSDLDPNMGIETRKRLLDRLAGDRSTFVGYHLPQGGFGRAVKSGEAYKFVEVG